MIGRRAHTIGWLVAVVMTAGAVMASAATAAAPVPHRGRVVIVARVSGRVTIRQPHGRTAAVHHPVALRSGGQLDTVAGVAAVTVATGAGPKTAQVTRGDSRVTQAHSGETTFTLTGRLACAAAHAASAGHRPHRTLWIHDHHGPFTSRGRYATGAARGTEWTTTDTCASTTIHVRLGTVLVADLVLHHHVLVHAGHSYTASRGPLLSWTAPKPIGNGAALNSISCPTTSFCAATDTNGDVLTSADPAGGPGTWSTSNLIDEGVTDDDTGFMISCASPTLCVATDVLDGDAYVSTDPTGGAATWTSSNIVNPDGDGINDVTCPSTTLCVAVDMNGNVLTTTDPASDVWSTAAVSTGNLQTVTCAGTALCIAGGNALATSSAPSGGVAAWRTTTALDPGALACPTATLCVINSTLGPQGDGLYSSTSPTGGPSTYHLTGDEDVNALACPSTGECIGVNDDGDTIATTDPTAGPWKTKQIDEAGFLNGIACPSTSFCVTVDGQGDELIGTAG